MWEKEQNAQQAQQGYYEEATQPIIDIGMVEEDAVNAYMARVFGWMFIGLLVTAFSTLAIIWGMDNSPAFQDLIWNTPMLFIGVVVVEFILVIAISARVTTMNPGTAKFMFMLYAVLNGLTFGFIAVLYASMFMDGLFTVALAFGITAVCFGVMAVIGMTTQTDLTRFSNLFIMGLVGLIIASLANVFFIGSMGFDFLIIIFGLFLFMGLTAYHANRIKLHYAQIALNPNAAQQMGLRVDQEGLASNLAISGALSLYLAFINMFWFILRLLARRN
ncbi:MAG: Bax inhibitor-1/YccA family protein [Defluviitaleaceae bacterium]|nr:Bax inhibitor-1/YccA family protein [Defluviitaleaceae bacterium]MCL2276152.1 Bax inhibitor-1/YccA family protein [Defluviitaleaceae bacterium]